MFTPSVYECDTLLRSRTLPSRLRVKMQIVIACLGILGFIVNSKNTTKSHNAVDFLCVLLLGGLLVHAMLGLPAMADR